MSANLSYTTVRLDLATARGGGTPIAEVQIGSAFQSVLVQQLPVGAVVEIAFGANGESKFFPLTVQGQSLEFFDDNDCPLFESDGLFIRNPVGVGTLILVVGFECGKRDN